MDYMGMCGPKGYGFSSGIDFSTLVPEVFLDFSPHERAAREPPSGEKEKPLVTLDLNLTFMQTPGSGSDPHARIG